MTANSWWTAVFSFVPRKPASSPSMFDLDLLRDVDALSQQKRDESTHRDLQLARTLNAAEYEETEQSITCLCCFGDYPFEDLCQCPNAHLFCKGCVTRVVEEGLFGQGRLRGQEVPCMSSEGCEATFSSRELERILPENVFRVWEDAVVENGVREAGLKVVKCAFCNYVEEAPRKTLLETYKQKLKLATLPHHLWSLTDTLLHNPIFPLSLATLTFFLLFPSSILISWLFSAFVAKFLDKCFTLASDRWRKPRPHVVPPAFNCGNPKCGRASCTVCGKEWEALHRCFEKEVDELRCPSCSISFSKLSGCNKMTCPRCGYIMCYICRKDIADEKYKHFCEHFRPIPGPCRTCQKCDLYYVADDRATRRAAGLKAKEEWVRRHPGREGVDVDVEAMA
ncbi:hypothetical protein HK104_008555 [Borealophlyctis nickersoniae]|nr:hypothetical protein HK104_008555 [Borealophlyctis nickersoniae]